MQWRIDFVPGQYRSIGKSKDVEMIWTSIGGDFSRNYELTGLDASFTEVRSGANMTSGYCNAYDHELVSPVVIYNIGDRGEFKIGGETGGSRRFQVKP
jgi:hypothetical protein